MQESSSEKIEIVEVHAIIKGRVQGVGFRATVRYYARQLGLLGSVRNLPDGSVEICVQGPNKKVLELFQFLHREFGSDHISNIDHEQVNPQASYEGFNITY
jgi:acylphosphatase